jgi:hypothetical protein
MFVEPVPIRSFLLLGEPVRAVVRLQADQAQDFTPSLFDRAERAAPLSTPNPSKRSSKIPIQLAMFELVPLKKSQDKTVLGNYHVVPNERGEWALLRDGAKRATSCFATKSEAVERGRDLARKYRVDLVEHNKHGGTGRRSSFGEHQFALHAI